MKRKSLYLLIAVILGGAALTANAQSTENKDAMGVEGSHVATEVSWPDGYDSRWYIAPTVGGYHNDGDRNTNSNQFYYGLGFGRFISPDTSIDFFVDRTKRNRDGNNGSWANNNVGVKGNFYFRDWNQWRPYLSAGVLGSRHANNSDNGWSPAAQLGFGLSKTIDSHADFRIEAAYRYDWDDDTNTHERGYGDWLLGASIVARLGAAPKAAEPVAPAATCDQLDDDNDGVNNCEDQCPNTAEGVLVGPDGCPQQVVIDLRGVNFKFDRPSKGETDIAPTLQKPTQASLDILNKAIDVLQRYPKIDVTVAGYTDSIGSEAYNQKLSERRAAIVYNYLTSHGIDASRLDGPIGHGENDPVATNKTKDGRALNRRTELQVDESTATVDAKK